MGTRGKKKATPETFGQRLRAARIAAGLAATVVAAELEVAVSTYYSWEANARRPRDVVGLATAVRTSVGALYGERAA